MGKEKIPRVETWIVNGFLGTLALMIYNFLLYILTQLGTGGFIGKMEEATGYFGLRSFIDFNFSFIASIIGIVIVFAFSFLLGIGIGKIVEKKRRKGLLKLIIKE